MQNKQEWFDNKVAAVQKDIMSEVQLSADIVARIDTILKRKQMTQRELAHKMGKSEAVISRWTTGLPNLTIRSITAISTALGEPLIRITED
ncbi:MAG: helix-turn-helix domain-containing protein [Bacteroidales bacterium]|nr:helix-turn-helix domain-containing protein [Bacteroidales bacterium]